MAIFDRGMVPATTKPMRILSLLLALLMVGVSPVVADPRKDTDTAMAELRVAETALQTATSNRTVLGARYEAELRTIDRLKKQRGSWRRDRQLRESLAASLETAKQLEAATAEQKRAAARQEKAKQKTLAAVATELAQPTAAARVVQLTRERARLTPAPAAPRKIVIPDLEVDPLADPEELEQQAAAIRQSEEALAIQVASLDQRATRLDKVAELRRQHKRAGDLSEREEGQTRRGTFTSNRGVENADSNGNGPPDASGDPSPAPGSGSGSGGGPLPDPTPPPPAVDPRIPDEQRLTANDNEMADLAESSTVLGDVIDAVAIESLRKAQASTDPAVRAAAAKKARDSAAAKLELLRKHRAAIEARARGLRGTKK